MKIIPLNMLILSDGLESDSRLNFIPANLMSRVNLECASDFKNIIKYNNIYNILFIYCYLNIII